jgi:hypothetical protein
MGRIILQHRTKMSQKATELTSFLANLHLEKLWKNENLQLILEIKKVKETKRTIYFPDKSQFRDMCKDFRGEHDLCMSCKKRIHKYCAGMKKMYNFFLLQLHYCCKNNLMN